MPEEFRIFKRNNRDGIDPKVTAAVPAEQFRGVPWNCGTLNPKPEIEP